MQLPSWARGLPVYAKLYWIAVFGAAGYYGIEWLITPKVVEEPKEFKLENLTKEQLEKLKNQRLQQRAKEQ